MENRLGAFLLSIILCGSCVALHGADQALIELLIDKGLLTEADADTLSDRSSGVLPTGTDWALVELLVSKGHLTQTDASTLGSAANRTAPIPEKPAPQVTLSPKSKNVTALKMSGRIQAQYDSFGGVGSGASDRDHFYFRRLFLGGHARLGDNWGGDIVLDFSDGKVFFEAASAWFRAGDALRIDVGQLKVPFGLEETTSAAKTKAIERSLVDRQFAEAVKFNARHAGIYAGGDLGYGLSYSLTYGNAGQNDNSQSGSLKAGEYGFEPDAQGVWGQLRYDGIGDGIGFFGGIATGSMPMGVDDDGNDYTGGDFRAYNLFGGFEIGALNLEAEYMNGEADIPGASNEEHDGYMIQAAYTVRNPADGIWEFVYRYSTVEGSTPDTVNAKEVFRRAPISDPRADGLHQHYIGLNYLIQGHDTKLMFGYEINTIEDAAGDGGADLEADGFRARLQILF